MSAQSFALARTALDGCADHRFGQCEFCRASVPARARFITLTQAPEGWEETRTAVKVWLRNLRRRGYDMETLTVVEKGSDTGMKHVHAVQWGDYVPKEVLSESWSYGHTQIEAARAASDYLGKGVLKYVAKGIDDADTIEEHMNLNGGRAAHWTRGFFGGMGRNAFRQEHPLPGIYFVHTDTGRH